jgi:hypothetical protein
MEKMQFFDARMRVSWLDALRGFIILVSRRFNYNMHTLLTLMRSAVQVSGAIFLA